MKQTAETESAPGKHLERWGGDLQAGADLFNRFLLRDKSTACSRDGCGPQGESVPCAAGSEAARLADVERRVTRIEALLARPDTREGLVGASSSEDGRRSSRRGGVAPDVVLHGGEDGAAPCR